MPLPRLPHLLHTAACNEISLFHKLRQKCDLPTQDYGRVRRNTSARARARAHVPCVSTSGLREQSREICPEDTKAQASSSGSWKQARRDRSISKMTRLASACGPRAPLEYSAAARNVSATARRRSCAAGQGLGGDVDAGSCEAVAEACCLLLSGGSRVSRVAEMVREARKDCMRLALKHAALRGRTV